MRKMVETPPSWSLWRAARMVGTGQKMTVEKKMNILAGDCGAEETEQQDWSPLGKTKAGAKSGLPPIIFSGLIRWEADLGPCGFCGSTMQYIKIVKRSKYSHIKIVSDQITRAEYFTLISWSNTSVNFFTKSFWAIPNDYNHSAPNILAISEHIKVYIAQ